MVYYNENRVKSKDISLALNGAVVMLSALSSCTGGLANKIDPRIEELSEVAEGGKKPRAMANTIASALA